MLIIWSAGELRTLNERAWNAEKGLFAQIHSQRSLNSSHRLARLLRLQPLGPISLS